MNLDRVKQVLKKVNALVENLDDQGQTSALEKDLLKRYLRDLYEHVSDLDFAGKTAPLNSRNESARVTSSPQPVKPEPKEPAVNTTVVETPSAKGAPESGEMHFAPEQQTTYYDAESHEVPAEAKVPEPEESVIRPEPEPTRYFPPEPAIQPKQDHVRATSERTASDIAVSTASGESRFAVVFSEKGATDLADRIKLQKIQSIEAEMGINQRLQTINELFDGDHAAFVDTIKQLNTVSDFTQAKRVLIKGAADKFNWDNDNKAKLASDFVDLVRRKYV